MPKIYRHEIVVSGRGPFPLDMLRYDQCWPATEADTAEIVDSLDPQIRDDSGNPVIYIRLVKLSDKKEDPGAWTMHRWTSFGWV